MHLLWTQAAMRYLRQKLKFKKYVYNCVKLLLILEAAAEVLVTVSIHQICKDLCLSLSEPMCMHTSVLPPEDSTELRAAELSTFSYFRVHSRQRGRASQTVQTKGSYS